MAAITVLISGIFMFTEFLKSRTKHDLVASIISLIVLGIIGVSYYYARDIKTFLMNRGVGMGVQSVVLITITIAVYAFFLYPGIRKNLSKRKEK